MVEEEPPLASDETDDEELYIDADNDDSDGEALPCCSLFPDVVEAGGGVASDGGSWRCCCRRRELAGALKEPTRGGLGILDKGRGPDMGFSEWFSPWRRLLLIGLPRGTQWGLGPWWVELQGPEGGSEVGMGECRACLKLQVGGVLQKRKSQGVGTGSSDTPNSLKKPNVGNLIADTERSCPLGFAQACNALE
ncbi:hypothetical protein HHK36_011791 [Tetracentron sinense]|uniref:Uncharacterized protein n=1 Tax=Tetracentron sinense TaxID=13715 RepID=A0A834ZJ98_TETSI|nr:hypothetical protein HHK36_011791 [Tetracentron sinense]